MYVKSNKFFIELVRDPKTGAIVDMHQIPTDTVRVQRLNGTKTYLQVINEKAVQDFAEKDVLELDPGFINLK